MTLWVAKLIIQVAIMILNMVRSPVTIILQIALGLNSPLCAMRNALTLAMETVAGIIRINV